MLTKTPEMTDSAVLAKMLDDMEFLGLIKLKPDVDKVPAIDRNPQAQDQHATSDKAGAWRCWSAEGPAGSTPDAPDAGAVTSLCSRHATGVPARA